MDDPDPSEEPNLNTGTPWSSWDDEDVRWGLDHNGSIAGSSSRTPNYYAGRLDLGRGAPHRPRRCSVAAVKYSDAASLSTLRIPEGIVAQPLDQRAEPWS